MALPVIPPCMPCEMCGNEAPLKTAVVEGTEMRLCPDCRQYGTEKTEPESSGSPASVNKGMASRSSSSSGSTRKKGQSKSRDVYESHEKVLAEDYGDRVRKAREKAGFTVEELSNELNEKRSVISKTEAEDHHPNDELVTKLERKLDITLMVKPEPTQKVGGSGSSEASGPMTLGDMLKEQMDEEG